MITLLGSRFSDHNYSTVPGIMVPNGSVSCLESRLGVGPGCGRHGTVVDLDF